MLDILLLIKPDEALRVALEASFRVNELPDDPIARDELLRLHGREIQGIVTSNKGYRIDEALLEQLPSLRVISCYTSGMDSIDLDAVHRRNLVLVNNSEVIADAVADLAMGLLLTLARDINGADRYLRAGQWPSGRYRPGHLLRGRRMGIVGMGQIGQAIAARAQGFGIEIAYHSPKIKQTVDYPYFSKLIEMSQWCDILTLSCPGGEKTRGLVDADVLKALGPTGWLINVSRGSVVNEAALISALADGSIAGAALDVFADEPNVPETLRDMSHVVLSPHQGSLTLETRALRAIATRDVLWEHLARDTLLDGNPSLAK